MIEKCSLFKLVKIEIYQDFYINKTKATLKAWRKME